ncbi:MAG: ATP-binding protein [Paludibacteraceae bacterium]|nr:ATP-binding protein [Paludibacteraceae bacterium]
MENSKIIGRKKEQHLLNTLCNKKEAQLIAVYGRRRVGKTFLIKNYFNNEFDFFFTGSYNLATNVQLSLFREALQQYSHAAQPNFKTWFEAFAALQTYISSLSKERVVVFIDEIPWMDMPNANFIGAFSYFWNTWGSSCEKLKLFVCGSATTWMLNKFVGDKGGLYGRSNRSIYIAPFSLNETELFLKDRGIVWTRQQITETYMILGGIPYYLDMLDGSLPLSRNIDNLFFNENGNLRREYDFLFRSLYNNSGLHKQIVESLSKKLKGMSQNEIKESIGYQSGGAFSEALENLEKCDFIRKYNSFGKKNKDAIYQLSDQYSLFYLHFVTNHNGQDSHFWENLNAHTHDSWAGYAFEQVCFQHINQIKSKLGIRGTMTNAYSWSCQPKVDKDGTVWKGAQIDLLLQRADQIINICEVKYSKHPYVITADYYSRILERNSTFVHRTKAKEALHNTFITTLGVQRNQFSEAMQSEVVLDDLFKEDPD